MLSSHLNSLSRVLNSLITLPLQVISSECSIHTTLKAVAAIEASGVVGLDMVSASDGVDRSTCKAGPTDLLDLDGGETLLVVVNGLDGSTESTALEGAGDDVLALDAHDVHAMAEPMRCGVAEDEDEADHGDEVGDAGSGGISNSTLDRGEDSSNSGLAIGK